MPLTLSLDRFQIKMIFFIGLWHKRIEGVPKHAGTDDNYNVTIITTMVALKILYTEDKSFSLTDFLLIRVRICPVYMLDIQYIHTMNQ